jgi:integral membrane protein
MKQFFTTSKGHLRLSALLEGISYLLLLLIAMPLKYWAGIPEPVQVVGMAHGVLFVWYVMAVLAAKFEFKLSNKNTALALLASLLPLGTFYADAKIFKHLYRREKLA